MLNRVRAPRSTETLFYQDVVRGLEKPRKSIPCRWLYDERGSAIFERIALLDEYYPARTETRILQDNAGQIATFAAHTVSLLEFGAGSAAKTEILLAAIAPQMYVPIDICCSVLEQTARRLRHLFPNVATRPVVADFVDGFAMPAMMPSGAGRTAFFPGSTIGNLTRLEADGLLRKMRRHTGHSGRAIIGVDLRKDLRRILRAYDDSDGVTAAFNLNLLERMNSELAADFDVAQFAHEVRWNEAESAVEMHLVSLLEQDVAIGNRLFNFRAHETIHTESSRKYDVDGFTALAQLNGWCVTRIWQDAQHDFAVFGLVAS